MKNKITTNYLFKSIFIPLLLLTLYFGIYKLCASIINIEGVNTVFTSRTLNYLLALTLVVLVTLIFVRIKSKEKILLGHEKLVFNPRTILLILLPLTPVVQYIVTNSGILSSTDVILILLFFVLFSLFFIILIRNSSISAGAPGPSNPQLQLKLLFSPSRLFSPFSILCFWL